MTTAQPRRAWGAAAPAGRVYRVSDSSRDAFVVHWLGPAPRVTDPARRLLAAQRFHIGKPPHGRGWADIGYNLAVGLDGSRWEARGWTAVGAHAPDWNRRAYGCVVLMGQGEHVTRAALDSIAALYWEACERAGKQLRILDHSQTGRDTGCAGSQLRSFVTSWSRDGVPRPGQPAPPDTLGTVPATSTEGPTMMLVREPNGPRWFLCDVATKRWVRTMDELRALSQRADVPTLDNDVPAAERAALLAARTEVDLTDVMAAIAKVFDGLGSLPDRIALRQPPSGR